MNRRLLVILLAVAVIIGIIAALFSVRRNRTGTTNTNIAVVQANTNAPTVQDVARDQNASEIRRVAIIVAEANGSGPASKSNQRLASVLPFLTANLQVFAKAQAERKQNPVEPEKLEAAKAVSETLVSQEGDKAIIEVTLQIATSTVPATPDSNESVARYEKIRLTLQNVEKTWLVSEVLSLGPITI